MKAFSEREVNLVESQIQSVFKVKGIDVSETDLPIIQEQWKWLMGLKETTKEMESGSYDIAMTHIVKGERK